MSEESVPQQTGAAGRPKGLLEQMEERVQERVQERVEELMAAPNANLSALADLQAGRPAPGTADGTD
ncbi:hypothetical protein ABZV75_35795 [Streptomyces flaveolus]|uniref:hypothetical protein n=1 Tax=Streptomyces flaveolus TaxID=67297 RepID=UPI0033B8DAD2